MNVHPLNLIQGDSYTLIITFDSDQSDYTFTGALSDGTAFTVTVDSAYQISLFLSAAQTAGLNATGATQYHYSVKRSDNAATPDYVTVAGGRAVVTDGVGVVLPQRAYRFPCSAGRATHGDVIFSTL